jgi:hypothetical protein
MKVKDAIKVLKQYDKNEELCISWWGRELFYDENNEMISEETWAAAVDEFDNAEGYDSANQLVWSFLNMSIEDHISKKEKQ